MVGRAQLCLLPIEAKKTHVALPSSVPCPCDCPVTDVAHVGTYSKVLDVGGTEGLEPRFCQFPSHAPTIFQGPTSIVCFILVKSPCTSPQIQLDSIEALVLISQTLQERYRVSACLGLCFSTLLQPASLWTSASGTDLFATSKGKIPSLSLSLSPSLSPSLFSPTYRMGADRSGEVPRQEQGSFRRRPRQSRRRGHLPSLTHGSSASFRFNLSRMQGRLDSSKIARWTAFTLVPWWVGMVWGKPMTGGPSCSTSAEFDSAELLSCCLIYQTFILVLGILPRL